MIKWTILHITNRNISRFFTLFDVHYAQYSPTTRDLQQRIAYTAALCHRDPAHIKLLAISKTQSPSRISEAYHAGQTALEKIIYKKPEQNKKHQTFTFRMAFCRSDTI